MAAAMMAATVLAVGGRGRRGRRMTPVGVVSFIMPLLKGWVVAPSGRAASADHERLAGAVAPSRDDRCAWQIRFTRGHLSRIWSAG